MKIKHYNKKDFLFFFSSFSPLVILRQKWNKKVVAKYNFQCLSEQCCSYRQINKSSHKKSGKYFSRSSSNAKPLKWMIVGKRYIHYIYSYGHKTVKVPAHRPYLLCYSRQLVLHVTLKVRGIDIRIPQYSRVHCSVRKTSKRLYNIAQNNSRWPPKCILTILQYVRSSKLPRGFSCK